MPDENENVEQEVVQPSEEEVVVELQEDEEEPKKGSAEYNFRELRKITEDQKKALEQQGCWRRPGAITGILETIL